MTAHGNNLVTLIEVGPRDGLQNSSYLLSLHQKIALIQFLLDQGVGHIEAGSFVRADAIPALADTSKIATHFSNYHNRLWYLVPNMKGLKLALEAHATQLALFTAASSSFNQRNIGMTTLQSLDVIHECIEYLRDAGYHILNQWSDQPIDDHHIKLRLYVSTAIECPYEGRVPPHKVKEIIEELMPLGFAQVSLGDTLGVGVPHDWHALLKEIHQDGIGTDQIAMHCHNTYGTALACIRVGLDYGIRNFDASIGGLGGCPFAPGASGNLATEDLLYFLQREGFTTGLDLTSLSQCFHPDRTSTLVNRSSYYAARTKSNNC